MQMLYKQPAFWIRIAKTICLISFIMAFFSLVWFCYLIVDNENRQTEQESKIDNLMDSHNELIEKIDELINVIEQDGN